jgi:hypothetical protein
LNDNAAFTVIFVLAMVVPPLLYVSVEFKVTFDPEKFMLLMESASLIRTVSLLNASVPAKLTEPLLKFTVPPLNVQFVQETFELIVKTTPGVRLTVQLLQELSEPNEDVLTLTGML